MKYLSLKLGYFITPEKKPLEEEVNRLEEYMSDLTDGIADFDFGLEPIVDGDEEEGEIVDVSPNSPMEILESSNSVPESSHSGYIQLLQRRIQNFQDVHDNSEDPKIREKSSFLIEELSVRLERNIETERKEKEEALEKSNRKALSDKIVIPEKESLDDIRDCIRKAAFVSTINYFPTVENTNIELDKDLRRVTNFVEDLNIYYKDSNLIKPFDENLLPPKELMEGKDCMIFSKIAFDKFYKSLFFTHGKLDQDNVVVDYKDIAFLFNQFFFVVPITSTKTNKNDIYHYYLPNLQVIKRKDFVSQFPSVNIQSTDVPNMKNIIGTASFIHLSKEDKKYHYFKKEGSTYLGKPMHIVDYWIKMDHKKQADQFTFDTSRPWGFLDKNKPKDSDLGLTSLSFNTYQGNQWARNIRKNLRDKRTDKEEDEINEFLRMFQTYIHMALCSGNEAHTAFTYSWILQVLFEQQKTEIMLTLISKPEGTGKSTLSNIMTLLMGTTLSVQAVREVFTHKFVGPIFENTRLLYVDEESNYHETKSFDKKSQDNLKSIMTLPTLMLEAKNHNLHKKVIVNNINILSTTNNLSPSYIKSESDNRRFFVLEVSTFLHRNEEFWTKFYHYYDRYIEYIWDYLYTLYVFEVFPFPRAKQAIQTYALALSMLRTMPPMSSKWSSFLARKEIGNSYEKYRRDLTRKFENRFCLRLSLTEIMEELDNKDAITVATFLNAMFEGVPLFQVSDLSSLQDLPSYDKCVEIFCRFQQVNKENYTQYISCQQLETVSKKRSLELSKKEASKSKQKRKQARADKFPIDPTQQLLFSDRCQISDAPQ